MEGRTFWNVERNGNLLMYKREQGKRSEDKPICLTKPPSSCGLSPQLQQKENGVGRSEGYLKLNCSLNYSSHEHSTLSQQ